MNNPMYKSPFRVVPDFVSPLMCEEIVDELDFITPETDKDGIAVRSVKNHEQFEDMIFARLESIIPQLEQHYGFKYKGTEQMEFEWVPQGAQIEPHCESAEYLNGTWAKTRYRDFTCVLFLTDFNDNPPFDDEFECYGGKLEFPSHQFGFNPQRGTMIIYPSDPRFTNGTAQIIVGELHQVRIHIAATEPYAYNPKDFPGNFSVWFNDL